VYALHRSSEIDFQLSLLWTGGVRTTSTEVVSTYGTKNEDNESFPHPRNPGKRVNLTHKLAHKDSQNS